MDEETEELSEDLKNISGDLADLTKINGKGGIQIFTDETRTTYKSTYQILKEIATIWDQLSDKQHADILEKIAGKRGGQVISGLLSNFDEVERALKEMEGAAGSAEAEMNIVRDSLDFKVNALKQTWVGTLQDILDRGTISGFIEGLTVISELLGKILEQGGLLGSMLTIGAGIWGSRNLNLVDLNNKNLLGTTGLGGIVSGKNKERKAAIQSRIEQLQSDRGEYSRLSKFLKDNRQNGINLNKLDDSKYGMLSEEAIDRVDLIGEKFNGTLEQAQALDEEIGQIDAEIEGLGKTSKNISGLGNIFKSIGSSIINGLLSAGISMAVSAIATGILKWADSLYTTRKEAEKLASTFNSSFSEMQSEQNKLYSEFKDVDKEFEELSKGVDSLGRNVNLTDEEFERYHEITQKIASTMPELISGYDEQGNAIVRLKDDVESLSDAYREASQAQADALYREKNEEGDSVVEGAVKDVDYFLKDAQRGRDTSTDERNTIEKTREIYKKLATLNYEEAMSLYEDTSNTLEQSILDSAGIRSTTTEEEYYDRIKSNLRKQQRDFESDFTAHQKTLSNIAMEYAETLPEYWSKSMDDTREYLNSMLNNLDYDTMEELGFFSKDGSETLRVDLDRIESFLGDTIEKLNEFGDGKKIDEYFNLVTSFNNNEMTLGEYETKLQGLMSWVDSIPDEGLKKVISIIFNMNTDADSIEEGKNRLKELMGYDYDEEFANSLTSEQYEKIMHIKPKVEYDELGNQLSYIDKKVIGENKFGIPIIGYVEPSYNKDEIQEKISEDISPITVEVDLEPNASDLITDLDSIEKAFGGLDTVYESTVTNAGIADASDVATVNSNMGGVTFNETEFENINAMSNAIESYNKRLSEVPNNADEAQDAVNDLTTAYLDLSGEMDDLTEARKDLTIENLKTQGVENAEEVVVSRLSKIYKDFSKNLQTLSKKVAEYHDVLEQGTDAENYGEAADDIAKSLTNLFTTAGQNGEEIIPNIDSSFVTQNLELIKRAAEDDIEAIAQLRVEAAKTIDLAVNVQDQQIYDAWNQISSMIANLDGTRFEIGGAMDDSAIIASLNNILATGKYTVDEFTKMVSQISGGTLSADMSWDNKTVDLAIPTIDTSQYNSRSADHSPGSHVQYMKTQVHYNLPKFTYKYNGSATGSRVNYSPSAPSGGGSGGGGGGGGGGGSEANKPKDEAEETFDWIEVAIQRIEEEIARLDKVVGNSYDFWINRNKALLKEIEKTKEEIKAQEIAQKEYLRNASKVQVNNGRGLNDDDYGENDAEVKKHDQQLLDEAKKAWATGEYQKKVREGLMTGDDIENIQNHFLSDTIKFYQELYNKAVAAGDAVQDLKIKLGDLARTNFDHVKSEAEEAMAYFESYSDLINERISRTEEKGYFVSKKYYGALLKHNTENLNILKKEYSDLIKKRDEAVEAGYIAPYSSEWNQMNQEILDVAKSIEECTTKTVEFTNAMRQIDWDVFDFAEARIDKINEEFDFLIDLLDNQKLFDDYGAFNSRGWADTALHAGKYNTYMQQALDYAQERAKIEKELAKDNADKNLIERREELIKLQQESISNAYAEKEAVKSLVEEGINIHLQKLNELIDKYKESLHDAKNLYDYQKNIANQVDNISKIQKQLAAYEGDDSEEARATIQRLRKNLADAQTQLKETQWDKYISETEEFLSDMYEDYEKTLNKRLEDIDLLMKDMIGDVNTHGKEIKKTIESVSKDVAYKMTENATTFLNNGTLVSDFEGRFDTYATNIETVINNIKDNVKDISDKTVPAQVDGTKVNDNTAKKNVSTVRNGVDYKDVFDLDYYMRNNTDLQEAFGTDYNKYLDHFIKYGMKEGRRASATFDVKFYKNAYEDLRKAYGNNLQRYYEHYIKWGKKEKRKAYASGSKHINSKQLAWTQENGGELVYRSSDGAILTPLNTGDKVFTAEMTDNLWDMAQFKQIPSVISGGGNYRTITNNNAIAITLPNVQNYEQFKTALQNDPKMTQYIQQITLGEANGKAKLNKRKF